ncbi:CAP domain-containing protein [Roseomonas sp. HF4]|uniref:CAP domain-containing protein n=1 Tax=Roseomonas sp. HF4 TaxID=2562313 RepID=UPI00148504BE|nr:CAP domain-containing protein [Roseomonas sp. HF4]
MRTILLLLLSALVAGGPAMAADPGTQQAMLAEVNAVRGGMGLPPVRLEPRLSRTATQHSRDMLETGRLGHQGRDGSDPGQRLSRAGYRWSTYRENVAAGQLHPREVMYSWMTSPGHRANILAPDVTQMGIGFAGGPGVMAGGIPRMFWTMVLAAPR